MIIISRQQQNKNGSVITLYGSSCICLMKSKKKGQGFLEQSPYS